MVMRELRRGVPGRVRRIAGGIEVLVEDWAHGVDWLCGRVAASATAWLVVDPLAWLAGRAVVGRSCVFVPSYPEEVAAGVEVAVSVGLVGGVAVVDPDGLDGLWSDGGPGRWLWDPLGDAVLRGAAVLVALRRAGRWRGCGVDKGARVGLKGARQGSGNVSGEVLSARFSGRQQ